MLCPLTCGLPLQMCHPTYYVLREREGKHRHSFFPHPSFPRLNTDLQPTAATFSPVALINKLLRQLPRQLALLVRFPHSRVSPLRWSPTACRCVFSLLPGTPPPLPSPFYFFPSVFTALLFPGLRPPRAVLWLFLRHFVACFCFLHPDAAEVPHVLHSRPSLQRACLYAILARFIGLPPSQNPAADASACSLRLQPAP